jgi:pimeloyl-ACP methyl ester carboxylesterase
LESLARNVHLIRWFVIVVVVVCSPLVAHSVRAQGTDQSHRATTGGEPSGTVEPELVLRPCRLPSPLGEVDALCGELSVAESPEDPEGRRIGLNVVVMPAIEPRQEMVPLFELAGGPGVGVTGSAALYDGPLREHRRHRPVVLVDRRGTGGSNPLRCPDLEAVDPLRPMYPLELVRACRGELVRRASLDHYGTEIAAGDLDRVRAALGYDRIDLWGLSYGTILGQVYMRRFPERVRSAVLVGVAPVDLKTPLYHAAGAQRVLDLLIYECQMDPACNAAFPDLRREWNAVMDRFEKGPVQVTRRDPSTGKTRRVDLHRGPFAEAFRTLLGVTALQREVPLIIHRAAAGDFEPFLSHVQDGPSPFAEGLYLTVACSQGSPRIRPDEIHRFTSGTFLGDYRVREERAACAEWPSSPASERFFEGASADIPVLIMSGEMDHVTPPRFAADLCGRLPRCRMVSVPHLGHGPFDLELWANGDCFDRLALDFFASPVPEALNASCVATMVPPPFNLRVAPER